MKNFMVCNIYLPFINLFILSESHIYNVNYIKQSIIILVLFLDFWGCQGLQRTGKHFWIAFQNQYKFLILISLFQFTSPWQH